MVWDSRINRDLHRHLPEDFQLLCMLSNMGVTSEAKALSPAEISERTMIDISSVHKSLQKLLEESSVQSSGDGTFKRFFVTAIGVRKVLSLYS